MGQTGNKMDNDLDIGTWKKYKLKEKHNWIELG